MTRKFIRAVIFATAFLMATASLTYAQAIFEGDRSVPVESKNGMVVTSHTLSTKDALMVLKNGGNAIDAAVTAAFSLAVTQHDPGILEEVVLCCSPLKKRERWWPLITEKLLRRLRLATCFWIRMEMSIKT